MSTLKERFYQVMNAMGLTDYRVYTDIPEITQNMMVKLRKGDTSEVSTKILQPFLKTYSNVNANYIFTGDGDMFNDGSTPNVSLSKPYRKEELATVPFVPVGAAASFVESLYDTIYDMDTYGVMPEDGEILNEDYIVFQVEGDSMEPTIPDKAKILAHKINESQWENVDGVVVIVYGKILTVKRVKKNALYMDNKLILKADNSKHGEMDVERREIRGMWKAIRIISQKIQ